MKSSNATLAACALFFAAGCSSDPATETEPEGEQLGEAPAGLESCDPNQVEFSTDISNPYLPFRVDPGRHELKPLDETYEVVGEIFDDELVLASSE